MSDVRISAQNSISAIDNWLKALAGNLTGSNVIGFRQTRVQFEDVLAHEISAPAGRSATPELGPIAGIQYSTGGTRIKATRTDWSQGSLNGTQRPTDLALTGNGFFVLSKVKEPTSLKDLVFTRNGSFTFDLEPNDSLLSPADRAKLGPQSQIGKLRLVSQEGYFVMGITGAYAGSGADGVPGTSIPPFDASTNGGHSLGNMIQEPGRGQTGNAALGGIGLKPFVFPFIKDSNGAFSLNDDLTGRLNFNKSGLLTHTGTQDVPYSSNQFEATGVVNLDGLDNGAAPREQRREHYNKYVATAAFAVPDGLLRTGGTNFQWFNTAGATFFGVAGTEKGPVGSTNEITSGALETSNSSVNTTLPELTIAQKSFTANVKIVSVGNGLIDDVNQLVK